MLPDRMFTTFQTASRGLAVQRERINAASRNIANANTSSPEGSNRGYQPQRVQTSSPGPADFKSVLRRSMGVLHGTRPQHITESNFRSEVETGRNLGPSYEIVEKDNFRMEYDPNHPDANEDGMVRYPDIDMVEEMSHMVSANRLYEANLSAIEAEKEIIKRSIQI